VVVSGRVCWKVNCITEIARDSFVVKVRDGDPMSRSPGD
jgi:hypothetical protein